MLPSVPTYDPWAWLIWGREILHGDLVTTTGPSWKPFPVLFTVPFAALGDAGAPLAWLVIARAGGLLAIAMAYRLGRRLAGPVAGIVAAGALTLANDFIFYWFRGNSEGILVAVCLWAVERHLDGRRVDAFLLGVVAALLRPEIWPILLVYGCYLVWQDRSRRTVTTVLGGGALVMALWFVPEYVGSGDFLRAASRAREVNADSLANAAHPFVAVFERSYDVLTLPVYVGALIAVVVAVRNRDRLVLAMAATAAGLMLAVALMTQAGFAGNLRYVALPASLVCVLAGIGCVRLGELAWRWRGVIPLAALVVGGAVLAAPYVRADLDALEEDALTIQDEALIYGAVPAVIAAAGGEDALHGVRRGVHRRLPAPGRGVVPAPARGRGGDRHRLPAGDGDRPRLRAVVARRPVPGAGPDPPLGRRLDVLIVEPTTPGGPGSGHVWSVLASRAHRRSERQRSMKVPAAPRPLSST